MEKISPAVGIAAKRPEGRTARIARSLSGRRALPAGEKRQSELRGNATRSTNGGGFYTRKLQNLKDRLCSFENLLAAYREAEKDKRYRNEVIVFRFNLEENLLSIQKELLEGIYKVGNYREFYVHYPKARLVMALGFRDRIVQWAIYRQINPFCDKRFIQHSYGCRTGKGTLAAAQCLLSWVQLVSRKPDARDWVILKGDVSKYFYRVDHATLLEIYALITDDPWFIWLVGTIINNPDLPFGLPEGASISDCPREKRLFDVGMPIGNLTSQESANIYLDLLDQYVKHVLRQHFYLRYMDDFIVLCRRNEVQTIYADIERFLREALKLTISPKSKIIPALQQVEFVGYLVSPHGMRLRKKTSRHIKRSLRSIERAYAEGRIGLDRALATIESYFGMTEHCSGYNLRRWIADHIALQRKEPDMKLPDATAPPDETGRRFYDILPQEDGTVDVYLNPDVTTYTDGAVREYDVAVRVIRGVIPWDGMEEDIRARYEAWCESAEVIHL